MKKHIARPRGMRRGAVPKNTHDDDDRYFNLGSKPIADARYTSMPRPSDADIFDRWFAILEQDLKILDDWCSFGTKFIADLDTESPEYAQASEKLKDLTYCRAKAIFNLP